MPPTPETLIEILDDLVPAALHAAAWKRCSGAGWYYGHGSNAGDGSAFWKMDLEADPAFDAIWEHVRPRCEELAGTSLRVRRQYANGHTYGLGGKAHKDDGEFTLLYYPNPEWKEGWDGETVFYNRSGEIASAVRLRPNRCVFFDAGTPHAGRAPSRACSALRVTVAYKLERVSADGAAHVYAVKIPTALVDQLVGEKLARLSKSVSLPGFRPGNVPAAVLQKRYGAQARADVLNRLGMEAMDRALPKGSVASALELKRGAESGDVEIHLTAIRMADLPDIDFSQVELERLTADEATMRRAGITSEQVAAYFRGYLKAQVLDRLDAEYRFPVLPALVDREFTEIWKAAQAQAEIPADAKAQASAEFRAIAERRFRLGWVVAEMARRNAIHAAQGDDLEEQVIDHFIAQARVEERVASEEELRDTLRPS